MALLQLVGGDSELRRSSDGIAGIGHDVLTVTVTLQLKHVITSVGAT
jgi:hypothetical protein